MHEADEPYAVVDFLDAEALAAYVAFTDRRKAEEFEIYMRSGSGHAFAKRRLW